MGVYVYCVAPAASEPRAGLAGIDGAAVRTEAFEGCAVWLSELGSPPRPSLERVRRHHAVVAAAMAAGATPVPARFGQWLDSGDRLRRDVAGRLPSLRSALERVAGAAEFGVRVTYRNPAPPHPVGGGAGPVADGPASHGGDGRGAAYLRAAARRHAAAAGDRRRADEVAAAFRERLGPSLRAARVDALPPDAGLASIALLVDSRAVGGFGAAVEAVGRGFEELRLAATGPWPPYSFGA